MFSSTAKDGASTRKEIFKISLSKERTLVQRKRTNAGEVRAIIFLFFASKIS